MANTYPNQRFTTNLGLSLFGMDEVLAENMEILDQAFGAGSSINVNGTLVASPNLSSTLPVAPVGNTLVSFQFDINGNISAYFSTASASTVKVNSSTIANPNFNDTTPAASAGKTNVTWQSDGSGNVSAQMLLAATKAAVASNWLRNYDASTGTFTASQPAASDLSNGTTGTGAVVLASAISGFGSGTVTSFSAGALSPLFTTSVATATTTPSLTFALSTQAANVVLAGPTTGAAAAPTFRSLVAADIPSLAYIPTTVMTTLGDTIYGGASGVATRLAGNSTTTKMYLSQTGAAGPVSAAPAWAQIAYADISGTPQLPQTKAAIASNWLRSYDSTTGVFTASQPAYGDITAGAIANTTTATTQTAGDNSTKLATTAYVTSMLNPNFAGGIQPYITGGIGAGPSPAAFTTTNAAPASATLAFGMLFYVSVPISIGHMSIEVVTVSGATQVTYGIYSCTGAQAGTLLVSSTFNTSTGQSTGGRTNVISPAVVLQPGWYWYSWASNSTVPTFAAITLNASTEVALNSSGNVKRCFQYTPTVAGTLNSSISAVTAQTNFGAMPVCIFET